MYIGFDTSNYTTSVAVFDGEHMINKRQLLTVKTGERGLRQSDAVFQHTVNMPALIDDISIDNNNINAVAVSSRPRNIDGSYMPCFLVGINNAVAVSRFSGAPLFKTSHQVGHILAGLYSIDRLDLISKPFIAFHISGGTTEALLVEPDKNEIVTARIIAQSSDLKAGQAVDRAGVMMGVTFPCVKELDKLSLLSEKEVKIRPSMNGLDCSLSGVENKAKKMFENGESKEDISKYILTYISNSIDEMTQRIIDNYGNLPIMFVGGVMSNTLIRKQITKKYNAYFAKPDLSCDNACGIAIYAYLKDRK